MKFFFLLHLLHVLLLKTPSNHIVMYIFKFITSRCIFGENYLNSSNGRAKISFAFVRFVAYLIFTTVPSPVQKSAFDGSSRIHSAYMHVCPRRLTKRARDGKGRNALSNGHHFTNMDNPMLSFTR